MKQKKSIPSSTQRSIFGLLKPYRRLVSVLILLAVAANVLNLLLPKIISHGIDGYVIGHFVRGTIAFEFLLVTFFIFIFTGLQSIVQTYTSERVARDLRDKLATKISRQSYGYIEEVTPGKLLTNVTSDIDSVKLFVSQAIVSIISSLVLIIGAAVFLLLIDWELALIVLTIIPIIGITFFFVLRKVRALFLKGRTVIDWLNRVINESILGAALIRVLNSKHTEGKKFDAANTDAKKIGLQILRLFAGLIPIITFVANIGMLMILTFGGHFVISGAMSLGDFAAFNSYISIFIFPIFIIGFMSNVIAQATASYDRVKTIFEASEKEESGTRTTPLMGQIDIANVTVAYGEKKVLQNVSLNIRPGERTAIIGPTAAGKTQLLYVLIGLFPPTLGTVQYDGNDILDYEKKALHRQIGLVFQDSTMFNMTIRSNIAFGDAVTDENLYKAIDTAELHDFIDMLPQKLNTVVSERGSSLSGGQKQRIMLARALALNPKILLLDDFTARVDRQTEEKIIANIRRNYPNLTLVSVTQKIESIKDYDQIILLMEGEILARGTHAKLMKSSPEYVQIYDSQQSTSHYELHA